MAGKDNYQQRKYKLFIINVDVLFLYENMVTP